MLGIALVTASGDFSLGGGTWVGDIMLVGGTFFYALYTLKSKALLAKYSPLQFSAWTMTVGAVAMTLVSCRQIISAFQLLICAANPFLATARTPLTFQLIIFI